MDSIGKVVTGIATKASASQPTRAVALPKPRDTANAPPLLNRAADVELPKLFVGYAIDGQPREVRRQLTERERAGIQARAVELRDGLHPFLDEEVDAVDTELGAMLGGFRSMRQQGEDVEATLMVLRNVLWEFPVWAIAKGCGRIIRRETDLDPPLDPRWAPNDGQVYEVVAGIVKAYRKALETAEALLVAPVALPPPEKPAASMPAPKPGLPSNEPKFTPEPKPTPGYAARVAADMAARKARREQQDAPSQTVTSQA